MARPSRLTDDEVRVRLERLTGWELVDGKLHRELKFKDFAEAFGFMTSVALIAESMNHHPEWFNVYNRVVVDLNTHDVGGISGLDFEMAETINRLAP